MPERSGRPTSISIIVPAYNEQEALPHALERATHYLDERALDGEIVVVDDGSSDRTGEIAEDAAAEDERVRLVSYATNRGKGYAVREGVKKSDPGTDAVVTMMSVSSAWRVNNARSASKNASLISRA